MASSCRRKKFTRKKIVQKDKAFTSSTSKLSISGKLLESQTKMQNPPARGRKFKNHFATRGDQGNSLSAR